MEPAKTHEEIRAELIDKATQDERFRARLLDEPKAAINEALGIDLPDSVTVHVHEDTATTAHLVLPPSPALGEAELAGVAAGHVIRDPYRGRIKHLHQETGEVHS